MRFLFLVKSERECRENVNAAHSLYSLTYVSPSSKSTIDYKSCNIIVPFDMTSTWISNASYLLLSTLYTAELSIYYHQMIYLSIDDTMS